MLEKIILFILISKISAVTFDLNLLSDFYFIRNFTDELEVNFTNSKIEGMKILLIETQKIFSKDQKNVNEKNFWELIKRLQEHKYQKPNYFQSKDLMSNLFLIKFEEEKINNNINLFLRILQHDIYFIGLEDFCGYAKNISKEYNDKNYHLEKIVEEFEKLLIGIRIQMIKKEWNNFCGKSMAIRFGIYEHYKYVMQSYLKIFWASYYSLVIYGQCTGADPSEILASTKLKFLDTVRKLISSTKTAIQDSKHSISLCPQTHLTKDHEIQLETFQKIIISEQNLTSSGTCSNNCHLERKISNLDCKEISNCEYLSNYFEICPGKDGRRYEWFKDQTGRYYGQNLNFGCSGNKTEVRSEYSWPEFRYCDYCVCTCENLRTRRTSVSFREVISDVSNNWIVVGVKFVRKDLLYVQILEGLVSKYGTIISTIWQEIKEPDDFEDLVEGQDYGEAKKINSGDVIAPRGFVISGIRFRNVLGSIQMQIRATRIDFLQGTLGNSTWIEAISDNIVKFQVSSLEKDAGQSTVPSLDIREVGYEPPVPLQGLGMLHLGHEEFAGFLTFHAFDFDMSHVFQHFI